MPAFAQPLAPPPPAASPLAQRPLPDISLLTFGPGEIYWERFGHNAILVREGDREVAYNYGIFDFNQKNFFLNFARGYMTYRMAADPFYQDLRYYDYEGRWVMQQHLDMTPQQRVALRDFLEWNAQPENVRYRYDYFTSNCSTRVRDALDRVLGGALRRQLEPRMSTASWRSEAVRLISPDFWWSLSMDAALGPRADRPLNLWQRSFVPMAFMEALRDVRVTDADGHERPLVDGERQLLAARVPEAPSAAPDWRATFTAVGLAFAAVLFLLQRARRRAAHVALAMLAGSFTLLCGIGGLCLAVIWGLTEHWAGWRNESLLLFNPLCLLLVPAWFTYFSYNGLSPFARRLAGAVALLALLAALVRLVPSWEQTNLHWLALLLPAHLTLAGIAQRGSVRQGS